jgi:hypothetical protein
MFKKGQNTMVKKFQNNDQNRSSSGQEATNAPEEQHLNFL